MNRQITIPLNYKGNWGIETYSLPKFFKLGYSNPPFRVTPTIKPDIEEVTLSDYSSCSDINTFRPYGGRK